MAFSFGWRKSELLGLTVTSIDFLRGVVMLADSKNRDPREAPITAALRPLLQALVDGNQANDRLFPVKDVRYAWRRICKRAGVKAGKDGIILHDARRSSARNKRDAGVSESVVMSLQGWKTSAMFRRYAIVDNSDRLKALEMEQRYAANQLQNRLQPPIDLPN